MANCSPSARVRPSFVFPGFGLPATLIRLPRQIIDYPPSALLLNWEQRMDPAISRGVHAYARALTAHPAVVECIPAYASLLVRFAAPKTTAYALREFIFSLAPPEEKASRAYVHELPVCYDVEVAPDLLTVAEKCGLTPDEVVRLHTARDYLVYQTGYQPGFAFLGTTHERLAVPRREAPRLRVPAGAVGLAGRQTGVYPTESPGGWQLIGRCPLPLLRAGRDFTRLRAGDRVSFRSVSLAEYARLHKSPTPWPLR